jgi:hypothetical protein
MEPQISQIRADSLDDTSVIGRRVSAFRSARILSEVVPVRFFNNLRSSAKSAVSKSPEQQ